jgi:hypothetical protein
VFPPLFAAIDRFCLERTTRWPQIPAFPTILGILREKSGPPFYHFFNLQTTLREISVKQLLRKAYSRF